MKEAFLERRNFMLRELRNIKGIKINEPKGAFYLFPDVSELFGQHFDGKTVNNADDICLFLLEEAKVALVTGNAFGSPNCIRISYAASMEQLKEAVYRIKSAISQLN